MKNRLLNLDNDIDIIKDTVKDTIIDKYTSQFNSHEKSLECICINDIYNVIYDIVLFNKEINIDLTDDEFEYIYDLNSKLEILEELFENYIYNKSNLDTRIKVYTYRINMINEIKNKLYNIIHKKKFNI
jgi:hypothetical protein